MIINAYKINLADQEKNKKSEVDIIKEITNSVIKEEKELIESNNKEKVSQNILNRLYNDYNIGDEKIAQKIKSEIVNKIYGYGLLQKYIDNFNITDIRAVEFNNIFVKENGCWRKIQECFSTKDEFEEYVRFCAYKNNSNINLENPVVVFSDRKNALRIEAGIEPANVTGPSLVIRIHRKDNRVNLETLFIKHNMLDKKSYNIIKHKIKALDNIILCGKGGSGKTTLLKTIIERLPKEIAITTNEETAEFYLKDRNVIQRECILNRSENRNLDLEKLSRHSLVMSNDVIVIGELKGKEANSFFDSISTGHTGFATVHADSAKNAIERLITLIKKDIKAQYYTEEFLRRYLCSSIDYIVYMKDFKVNEILMIKYDNDKNNIIYEKIY